MDKDIVGEPSPLRDESTTNNLRIISKVEKKS